ncbi:MAG: phosphatase PAP2 family protein [Actinomycetota bacterium]|nr:phosphatase PAP2 family protein [Actinomycetota bacterium]
MLPSTDQQEVALLTAMQRRAAAPRVVSAARGLSHFGEHALGWLVLGALGALADRRRRRDWLLSAGAVAAAHGASIAVKRVVRRHRPTDPSVQVLVGTPSRLSFPSSHAASTTAAAVLYGALLRRPLIPVLVPPMLVSRLVLGVHYPTDVLVGSALGATIGAGVRRRLASHPGRGWR